MSSACASASASARLMPNSSARRTFSGAAVDQRRERLPLHELEHEKPLIALLAALEQHGDVRMRQLDRAARAVSSSASKARRIVRHDRRRKHFDRDGPPEIAYRARDTPRPDRRRRATPESCNVRSRLACAGYFFGGFDGRISTRLGRLRWSCDTRSTTTCATSSGRSFHSFCGSACPMKSVFTEPGLM